MSDNTLNLSAEEFTLEEAEILNLEVTDEIYECLLEAKKNMDRDNREQDELQALVDETCKKIHMYATGQWTDQERVFDQFLHLHGVVDPYFQEIEKWNSKKDKALAVYRYWLARYQKGMMHLNNYKTSNHGSIRGYQYWDLYNLVKDNWKKSKDTYQAIKQEADSRLSWLWESVKALPEYGDMLIVGKANKSLWPKYFQLVNGEEPDAYDPIAHKRDCPVVDNRMLVSDEAYYQAHMEDNQE